ncbi:MAG: 2'-5' RNA ligase family protein [Verrucomicrobiaceae bacterium]|nr:MAG: 2'-5' RNA ligase family protein [Verrucomicrobiaceae bacterium]
MLLCLAYPRLSEDDTRLIGNFRREHDKKYVDVVDPHWTMIFPGSSEGISQDDLDRHIQSVAEDSAPVDFTCRYALVYDDDGCDDYYVFLVPDEGFSGISLLHDRLYSDFMRPKLRLDIPYVPHIGIATSKDREALHNLATQWNRRGHEISGTIDELTLSSYDGGKVFDLKRFPLKRRKEQATSPNC